MDNYKHGQKDGLSIIYNKGGDEVLRLKYQLGKLVSKKTP